MNTQTIENVVNFAKCLDVTQLGTMMGSLGAIFDEKRDEDWKVNRKFFAKKEDAKLCAKAVKELRLKHVRLAEWSVLEWFGLDQLEGPEYWCVTALEHFGYDQTVFYLEGDKVLSIRVGESIAETLTAIDEALQEVLAKGEVFVLNGVEAMKEEALSLIPLTFGAEMSDLLGEHEVMKTADYDVRIAKQHEAFGGRSC